MEERPGIQRLCRLIAEGRVGIVLVSELSRLTRSPVDLYRFLGLCARQNTLCVANGFIEDRHTLDTHWYTRLQSLKRDIERGRKAH